MQLSENVKKSYANQYDDSLVSWRTVGAKYKAQNILKLLKDIKFDSVLEVGCGEGSILFWLGEWGFSKNLNGVEISESGVQIIKSKKIKNLNEVRIFDGYKLPYPDNHFDLIICSHVMEHVEHERILLREIKRVSKYQFFEVPIDFSFYVDRKLNHFLSYGHINIYTPSLFRFLLKSENFKIINDLPYTLNNEILSFIYKNNKTGFYKQKLKDFILNRFPYLKGIKPSAYAVLTSKEEKPLTIF